MVLRVLFVALLFSAFSSAFPASAMTYYVRPGGNDAQAGTSVATAWRSIEQVNRTRFVPGDQVLFEGGQTFAGGIWLRSSSQGQPARPIRFGSYGTGRAIISSGTSFGFYAHNVGGIEVRNLSFVGAGRLSNTNSGVIFYLDSAQVRLTHVVLDSLQVSGYRSTGISVGSWNGTSGYDNVRITHCTSSANGEAGIASYAQALAAHHNWYVADCQVFDNAGRADITTTHTGNGIVLSGIDGALIERCEAFNNGWLNANPSGGPVGIWGWCCNNLVIQKCESHHNRSGTAHDGGGFDLDGGCTNSVLQYNYSHDNEGPGYLLAQYPDAPPLHDVTIRYNISENDGRRHNQGAIMLWSSGSNGGIERAAIHNNTVYITPPADGSQPKAVDITSGGISGITFRNNIFQTTGGLPLLASATTQGLLFQGNAYWSSGQPLALQWGPSRYSTLAAWRAATRQEILGTRNTGHQVDPKLQNPGAGGTLASLTTRRPLQQLNAYQLLPASDLLTAGLDLQAEFGVAPGPYDFFGTATPPTGTARAVGAYEEPARPVLKTGAAQAAGVWCTLYPNPAREVLQLAFIGSATQAGQPVLVQLYDVLGRVQLVHRSPVAQPLAPIRIPLGELARGRYVLHVQHGSRRTTQAVVVE